MNFLFSNKQSVKMFKFDVMKIEVTNDSETIGPLSIDEPKFKKVKFDHTLETLIDHEEEIISLR